jgi:hypothetical protein
MEKEYRKSLKGNFRGEDFLEDLKICIDNKEVYSYMLICDPTYNTKLAF